MRPEVQKQQPHHFIRRWPRTRRQERGPNSRFLTVVVRVTRDELLREICDANLGHLSSDAKIAGYLLAKEASRRCPRGWTIGGPHGHTIIEKTIDNVMIATKEVGIHRKVM